MYSKKYNNNTRQLYSIIMNIGIKKKIHTRKKKQKYIEKHTETVVTS